MAFYRYNGSLQFDLPEDFRIERASSDDEEKIMRILYREYVDEDGNDDFVISFQIKIFSDDFTIDGKQANGNDIMNFIEDMPSIEKTCLLSDDPGIVVGTMQLPEDAPGYMPGVFSLMGFFTVDKYKLHCIIGCASLKEAPEEDCEVYTAFLELIKGIRVNGKRFHVKDMTAQKLRKKIKPSFLTGSVDDILALTELLKRAECEDEDAAPVVGYEDEYDLTYPDESLFQHYESKNRISLPEARPGIRVVVNSGGTDYNFVSFSEMLETAQGDDAKLLKRIIDADRGDSKLYKLSSEMQSLFRVNPSVFNPSSDRECEINDGYMQSAYMMSALRAFAWTLLDYCNENNCTPGKIDIERISDIIDFAEATDWLNYDGNKYCRGLCACNDVHVYYIPDSVSDCDRNKFLPDNEHLEFIKNMKEKFPLYNEITDGVHSLDSLRADLFYIYPAIRKIYEKLKADRNYDEELKGKEADVLYAWCVLAKAANEPFYSEDGPMKCFFSQLDHDEYDEDYDDDEYYETDEAVRLERFRENEKKRELEKQQEKKRKKEAAKASDRDIDNELNMYIILTNEKKLGKLKRSPDDFYNRYEEIFPTLEKEEIIKLRSRIITRLKDKRVCSNYKNDFKRKPVEEKFRISTQTLKDNSEETDPAKKSEWAIVHTREWYSPSEYNEVKALMDESLSKTRELIAVQMKELNRWWRKFSTARDSLEIMISSEPENSSVNFPDCSCFRVRDGEYFISVQLREKNGVVSVPVRDDFPWFWGVTVRDVWDIGFDNNINAPGLSKNEGYEIAQNAIAKIGRKYSEKKIN